jgi:hypothetical protein
MLTFPTLKTGSVAQYPLSVSVLYANEVLEFLAGDEQRYPLAAGPLRTWIIQLLLLDDSELAAVRSFFAAHSGSYATFSFLDPWTGLTHENCYVAADELIEVFSDEFQSGTAITIREGR